MTQPDLFDAQSVPVVMAFDGATYEPAIDRERLSGQMLRVYRLMRDGHWRTLADIHHALGGTDSEAGISARLRDCRKVRFGAHQVDRRRRDDAERGLFEYRLLVNPDTDHWLLEESAP